MCFYIVLYILIFVLLYTYVRGKVPDAAMCVCIVCTYTTHQKCKFYAKIIILQFNSLHWGKFSRHVCAAAIMILYTTMATHCAHRATRWKIYFIPFVCHINGFYLRYSAYGYVDLMVICLGN